MEALNMEPMAGRVQKQGDSKHHTHLQLAVPTQLTLFLPPPCPFGTMGLHARPARSQPPRFEMARCSSSMPPAPSFRYDRNTALDQDAHKRATSVYLIQRIVPMLPLAPSEELCSLNPGQERLAFPVMPTIAQDTKIIKKWFGKTIGILHSDGSGESSATDIDSDVEDENPLE
ncbi:hypothetical protein EW146_g9057 [Bondarzewia mesenterica]|uniref:RNB domain-containing protein n=1 Tax=Bondarzewia mesenterica TaxID=1095465 RepID=A0A4S4L9T2_9AGAM|nr:hypothetical protein EW146_g9057 [Bondarzewia mesenterica]